MFQIRHHPDDWVYQGALTFSLVLLLLASLWIASNHRFEADAARRRKNINIELRYCCIQALAGLLTIHYELGLVGGALILVIGLVYILYVNPKFMDRRLTK